MLRIALRVRLRYAPLRMTHRGIVLQYFIVFNNLIRLATLDTCLAAARSRSGENNTQLFSKTLVPLRYLKGKPFLCKHCALFRRDPAFRRFFAVSS